MKRSRRARDSSRLEEKLSQLDGCTSNEFHNFNDPCIIKSFNIEIKINLKYKQLNYASKSKIFGSKILQKLSFSFRYSSSSNVITQYPYMS